MSETVISVDPNVQIVPLFVSEVKPMLVPNWWQGGQVGFSREVLLNGKLVDAALNKTQKALRKQELLPDA